MRRFTKIWKLKEKELIVYTLKILRHQVVPGNVFALTGTAFSLYSSEVHVIASAFERRISTFVDRTWYLDFSGIICLFSNTTQMGSGRNITTDGLQIWNINQSTMILPSHIKKTIYGKCEPCPTEQDNIGLIWGRPAQICLQWMLKFDHSNNSKETLREVDLWK